MGTLNSIDVINQHYELRLDLYTHSYASLSAEIIDKAMDDQEISKYYYELLHFVLKNYCRYFCTANVDNYDVEMYA